jgi:hypothetical protein
VAWLHASVCHWSNQLVGVIDQEFIGDDGVAEEEEEEITQLERKRGVHCVRVI